MTKTDYEARKNELIYDLKCLERWKVDQEKLQEINRESYISALIYDLKNK